MNRDESFERELEQRLMNRLDVIFARVDEKLDRFTKRIKEILNRKGNDDQSHEDDEFFGENPFVEDGSYSEEDDGEYDGYDNDFPVYDESDIEEDDVNDDNDLPIYDESDGEEAKKVFRVVDDNKDMVSWSSDGWEKQEAKYLQLPPGRTVAAQSDTRDGIVHVFEPLESEGKWGVPPSAVHANMAANYINMAMMEEGMGNVMQTYGHANANMAAIGSSFSPKKSLNLKLGKYCFGQVVDCSLIKNYVGEDYIHDFSSAFVTNYRDPYLYEFDPEDQEISSCEFGIQSIIPNIEFISHEDYNIILRVCVKNEQHKQRFHVKQCKSYFATPNVVLFNYVVSTLELLKLLIYLQMLKSISSKTRDEPF